jgi:hypothetical protein
LPVISAFVSIRQRQPQLCRPCEDRQSCP